MSLRHKAPHAIRPAPRTGKQLGAVLMAGLERLEVAAAPTATRPDTTGLEPPQQRPNNVADSFSDFQEALNETSNRAKQIIQAQLDSAKWAADKAEWRAQRAEDLYEEALKRETDALAAATNARPLTVNTSEKAHLMRKSPSTVRNTANDMKDIYSRVVYLFFEIDLDVNDVLTSSNNLEDMKKLSKNNVLYSFVEETSRDVEHHYKRASNAKRGLRRTKTDLEILVDRAGNMTEAARARETRR